MLGMAGNPELAWAGSLEPVRRLLRAGVPACSSCRSSIKQPVLSQQLYLYIAKSGGFQADMAELKKRNGYDAIQILTDTGSITV
jgi:hypothetical protein